MTRYTISLCFSLLMLSPLIAQKIATFEVDMQPSTQGLNMPVSINLDNITTLPEADLVLTEITTKQAVAIPFQVKNGENRMLHWLIPAQNNAKITKRVFQLSKGKQNIAVTIKPVIDDGMLTIQANEKNLLRYYFKTLMPPKRVDEAYKRSGFIHPLWSPHGQVLTRIQPPDHYHHYGIWNPWTHVLFQGDTIDFWNLNAKKGTVRFANFVSNTEGGVFSEFETLHEHVVFKRDGSEVVAMNELQTVRVYRPDEKADYYIMDIVSKLNCATESPFKILAYRYAGMGWRATQEWDNKNSEVLSSEGKTRKDADGTKARWWLAQGTLGDDYGGAAMLSHPTNFNHPEPLRIWPENQYDRGDLFGMFAPTKDIDWLLEPNKTYVLRYRWLVFNGKMTKEKADAAWKAFAEMPKISVTLQK